MKRGLEYHGRQDLEDGLENVMVVMDDIQSQHHHQQTTEFVPMEEEQVLGAIVGDTEIFLNEDGSHSHHHHHHLDVNDTSIFSTDFLPLPDFPCMSSSSSTSSAPTALSKPFPTSSSSSSASSSNSASWTVLKSDAEENVHKKIQPPALSSTTSMELSLPLPEDDVDCLNVMEDLGYMDLIDGNEFWDPCTLFQTDNQNPQDYNMSDQSFQVSQDHQQNQESKPQFEEGDDDPNDGLSFFTGNGELAVIFFEWLKQNKDYISAEDMRSIKLKRSTIESASKRLGGTKEGKKQLLRLILEWVEQYQLQKKRMKEEAAATAASDSQCQYQESQLHDSNPNPNPSFQYNNAVASDPSSCFYPSPWMPTPSPYIPGPDPFFSTPMAPGYAGDPYSNVPSFTNMEYQTMESAQSWPPSQFSAMEASQYNPYPENENNLATNANPQGSFSQYPYQLYDGNGERLARLGSSATKEARKKRMARQRRLPSHHYRHHSHQTQHQSQSSDQSLRLSGENCTMSPANNPGNWVYWPSAAPSPMMMVPPPEAPQPHPITERPGMQPQNRQKHASSADKRSQGWKSEKNLKFLLQKVLKQSDVGNLGRIVLPKKEAESHLPELESRDGISIPMEDIGTSRVWNMKYRFWPNNKSRMYLLENTGDFVRANGLQEGDFIVIYADTKCGKYLIRGVKVRQSGPKAEGKKPAKKNVRNSSSAVALMKQLVK
ncbi:B3 domain-containing transcription factor ABI3-like [Nicotiana tomentosiformis]|uniref:B3 domain-containing transcription factor ABI3-like n=1 Tax=Nicotiana tomentosiformis TaxID=4098 RepID=UPI00051BCA80|nr:B3 domain-containing transcription factor ABI3-like isoform X2 [Nicotiana tomentosiformis]